MSSDYGDFCREQREWQRKMKPQWDARTKQRLDKDLYELVKLGFQWQEKNSWYQIRINDRLDIYPQSQSYHDIKKNKRGMYKNLVGFVNMYLKG